MGEAPPAEDEAGRPVAEDQGKVFNFSRIVWVVGIVGAFIILLLAFISFQLLKRNKQEKVQMAEDKKPVKKIRK